MSALRDPTERLNGLGQLWMPQHYALYFCMTVRGDVRICKTEGAPFHLYKCWSVVFKWDSNASCPM